MKKLLSKQHNTIVYLGKPPVNVNDNKSRGSEAPRQFGYARRPHRRTLSHERFKDHPKYGIYKGVRVAESWCGPKLYQDNNRIYRLWQPSGIDVIGNS